MYEIAKSFIDQYDQYEGMLMQLEQNLNDALRANCPKVAKSSEMRFLQGAKTNYRALKRLQSDTESFEKLKFYPETIPSARGRKNKITV
jgi:hypothetical protein